MRRTKATLIYKRTKNLRAVQLLLGHTKLESTVRYLGIEVDDGQMLSKGSNFASDFYKYLFTRTAIFVWHYSNKRYEGPLWGESVNSLFWKAAVPLDFLANDR
jgi:hypothetical protein